MLVRRNVLPVQHPGRLPRRRGYVHLSWRQSAFSAQDLCQRSDLFVGTDSWSALPNLNDEREDVCDSAGKKYAKDREERSDEKEIISDAIGLLVSKIRMLKKYVSDSVSTLKRPVL